MCHRPAVTVTAHKTMQTHTQVKCLASPWQQQQQQQQGHICYVASAAVFNNGHVDFPRPFTCHASTPPPSISQLPLNFPL